MRDFDLRADDRIAEPGVTCWRRCRAERVAFLVDGERCFEAIGESLRRAERSVLITGWDLHGAVRLWRGAGTSSRPSSLGELLRDLVRRRRHLHVHVLVGDSAVIRAAERGLCSPLRRWWGVPRRLHFHYDAAHPVGGAHHQKIVVVDDAVAFSGGLHDVQMAVDGEAARALGDLVRERWRRATGRRLRAPDGRDDRWPAAVTPDLRATEVAIACTLPAWQDAPPAVSDAEPLDGAREPGGRSGWSLVAGGVGLVALLALWQVLPDGWLDPARLASAVGYLRAWPLGPPAATLVGAVAASAMIPFVPLVIAAGMLFGPWTGFAVALGAGLVSAAMGYGIGRYLWRESVRRLAGRRAKRLGRILVRGGVPAMTVLRIVPVAPFAVVNLAAGSVGVRARDFMLGTLFGLTPGVFALTVLGDGALEALRRPGWETIVMVGVLVVVVGAGIVWGQRLAARRPGAGEQER